MRGLDRRTLLRLGLAGGAVTLAGCSSGASSASAGTGSPPTTTGPGSTSLTPGTSSATTGPGATLPAASPWVARPGEVQPAVKRQATRALQAIGTWSRPGGGTLPAAAARLRALGFDPGLARQAVGLLGPQPAAVTDVVNAQYGGILTSSASVLVVLAQRRLDPAGAVTSGGTSVDVRLVAASPGWRVTALRPAHPGGAETLSGPQRRVLADGRVRLHEAARADIASGQVHDAVCRALLALAERYVVDVSIVRSGHPTFVFGTTRLSDHPRGRAVDIWALDGRRVVEPANRAFVERAMRVAASVGPYQVGGPVDLDSAGTRYFSDRTHRDHLHLGFRT